MTHVRIKAKMDDDFSRTAGLHIKSKDLPDTYSEDGNFIYKVVTKKEYMEMLDSLDGVHMSELGLEATLDMDYEEA